MKKFIGFSISEHFVRVAVITIKKDHISIAALKEFTGDFLKEGRERNSDFLKRCRNTLKKEQITGSAFITPPDTKVVVKEKTVPSIPKNEIFKLIEAEIKDYAIFNHENVSLGFTTLEKEKNKVKIMWAGIKETDLMNIIKSSRKCGFSTRGVIPANFAEAKFISTIYHLNEPFAIVSVDSSITTMSFVKEGKLYFSYVHDTGSDELLKEGDISTGSTWSGNIATTITYVARSRNFPIKNIFLISQNSGIEKLLAILSQRIAYPIIIPKIDTKDVSIQDEELYLRIQNEGGSEFIRAVGTAILSASKESDPLLCDISKHILVEKKSMKAKIALTLLLLIAVNAFGIYFYPYVNSVLNSLETNLQSIQVRIKKAEKAAENTAKLKSKLNETNSMLNQYLMVTNLVKKARIKSTVLRELKQKLPPGVLVNSLSITNNGAIVIKGSADEYYKIFDFERNLSSAKTITQASITRIVNGESATFTIVAKIRGAQNEEK